MPEVTAYRGYVDDAVTRPLETAAEQDLERIIPIVEIGPNHEQQHQELMLTDILHAFSENPAAPAYDPDWRAPATPGGPSDSVSLEGGVYAIGQDGRGFSFDNESPRHEVLLQDARIDRISASWHAPTASSAPMLTLAPSSTGRSTMPSGAGWRCIS